MIKEDATQNRQTADATWDLSRSRTDIHLAMEEDETEWGAPAWCDWARCYVGFGNAPSFTGADLRNADFTDARLALAEFVGADARGAVLCGAELSFADFTEASLIGADLSNADLCKADLRRSDLRGAKLTGADLAYANLIDADLCGANLSGACLENAELAGARFDLTTELPFDVETSHALGMVFVTQSESGGNERRHV